MAPHAPRALLLQDGDTVLFIGDSITDSGWRGDSNRQLGGGYVAYVADFLAATAPERRIQILNRGISGNRVNDLRDRWETDVIACEPDWVSLSIGINDVWRRFDGRPELAIRIEDYVRIYRELLDLTRQRTDAKLVLMETSVIGEDFETDANRYLEPYNEAIRAFAEEYDATLVPIRDAFRHAIASRPGLAWTGDGVHPVAPGHMLMATTWLRALGATL